MKEKQLRKRLLFAALLLLTLVAGFALVAMRDPPPAIVIEPLTDTRNLQEGSIEVDPAVAALEGAEPVRSPAVTRVVSAAGTPLPPANVPVLEVIAALDQRARAGEPEAVCRLTAELLRCRNAPDVAHDSDQWANMLARQQWPEDELKRHADEIAEAIERNQQVQHSCEGVSAKHIRAIPRYFFAAGVKGHVPSMISFADAVGIGGEDIVADPELYALYRTHAASMFMSALESGHPAAVLSWQQALRSRGFRFLAGVLPPEYRSPGVAEALSRRITSMISPDAKPPRHRQTDPNQDEAARGDELFERHFRSSGWPPAFARMIKQGQPRQVPLNLSPCLLETDH